MHGHFTPLPQYGYPEVPAGMLRISANDLARFMLVYTQGGSVDGVPILRPETARAMRQPQFPSVAPAQGLVFYHIDSPSGHYHLVGHNGGDPGVSAEMYWVDSDPNGLGVVVLANSDATSDDAHPERGEAIYSVLERLLEYGSAL
jgi:CubicO group peptidase (beta-lactamase class C family)